MKTMYKSENKEVNEILKKARQSSLKGRLYGYEMYKTELQRLELSPIEYSEACRELARILEV